MNLDEIRNYLRTFFRGEETEEGRRLIDQWYHSFDERSHSLDGYETEEKEKLRKELWTDIRNSADLSDKKISGRLPRHTASRASWSIRIAAGLIILLTAILPVLYYQGILQTENSKKEDIIEYQTVSNPAGQSSQITLADGSKVWLSAASTLRYPEHFGDSLRTVELTGEAFFDVTHNPDKPFIVNSGPLWTRVLGTSFNIRVFEDEKNIQVTVATGRVAVRQHAESADDYDVNTRPVAVLTPDQQLVYNKKIHAGTTQTVKPVLYTSWKEGKLIFENHSFAAIAGRLERWYGVDIHFTDAALKQIRFKVTFENSSLEHALRMLQVIEDFKFEMEDDQVWIKPSA